MATNSERPRRFDLRTTIPLATETLVSLARHPKRSWVIPALTLITGIAFMVLMLELLVFPGPVSALAFEGGLRSRLSANYGADPVVAKIHELRLTIVEDVLGMDEGDGSGSPGIAALLQDPVPTATPKPTKAHTEAVEPSSTSLATEPSSSAMPTDASTLVAADTALPTPSKTPPPPTAAASSGGYCEELSITSMWVHGDNDVKAKVRNSGSKHVYLIKTTLNWPDVPAAAYVHRFEFDGDSYFHSHDNGSSPTVISGSHERLRRERTRTWEVDFNDEPDEGIYGSFSVSLTFDVPDQDAHCSLSGSTFRAPPAPTPEPTIAPSDIPEPTPTDTSTPTVTPLVPTATPTSEPTTPVPTDTETPTPETPTITPTE